MRSFKWVLVNLFIELIILIKKAYLRKIIVSANLLQRKFLPDCVNEKFDPDRIYDRVIKLLES